MGQRVTSSNTMNVLGMIFDSKLRWNEQVEKTIKAANTGLHGLRMIRKYFTVSEMKSMVTAVFMSRLYYGAEVWHIPGLTRILQKKIKLASANALRLCAPGISTYSTHTEIHQIAGRALPEKMCIYRHAIMMYKLFNNIICDNEFMHLNFQFYDNDRGQKIVFLKDQTYDVGKNILLNRFCELNNMIDKNWLSLSLETFKIKCKSIFLTDN